MYRILVRIATLTLMASSLPAGPLPDPLVPRAGLRIATAGEWRTTGRPATLRLFEEHVYGKSPELPPKDQIRANILFSKEVENGKGLLRELAITYPPQGSPTLYLLLAIPVSPRPSPVFLGLNFAGNHAASCDPAVRLSTNWIPADDPGVEHNRATEAARGTDAASWPFALALSRGYGMATLYHGDIDPDFPDFSNGIHPCYFRDGQTEPGPGEWGALGAWAWSLRVAASVLEVLPEIDPARICLMGHSRNGKTALWAGAQDERFALVVSNQSGCGGAALSRPHREARERLSDINTRFPHWFATAFHQYNGQEDQLPVDQHQLLALIAPRPLLVCSAAEDLWADPLSEFGSCVAADPVYRLLGTTGLPSHSFPAENDLVPGRIGYHVRPGKHGVGPADWKVFFDFADAQWK